MSKRKELQMQILQNYFSIQGNIATLKLVYETFSELINPNFGDDSTEKLNDKLYSDIREAISLLPKRFKLNLQIVIKDFGEYTKDECENIIKKNVGLVAYGAVKRNNKKLLIGCSLMSIGAGILLLSYLLRDKELWFDLINISGTLCVWEGVNTAFIERNLENKATKAIAKTICNITIKGDE